MILFNNFVVPAIGRSVTGLYIWLYWITPPLLPLTSSSTCCLFPLQSPTHPSRIHSQSDSAAAGTDHLLLDSSNGRLHSPPPAIEDAATSDKKANMAILIKRYFYQLLEGCSDQNCRNINCKNSGQVPLLTPSQAAAKALELLFQRAILCQSSPCLSPPCERKAASQTKTSLFGVGEESPSSSSCSSSAATIGRNNNNKSTNCDKAERVATQMNQEKDEDGREEGENQAR